MWQYSHSRVTLVVADGLAPIWHQDIYNHRDDGTRWAYTKIAQYNVAENNCLPEKRLWVNDILVEDKFLGISFITTAFMAPLY